MKYGWCVVVEETILEEIFRSRCFLDQSLFCSQILLNLVHSDFLLILLFFIKWSWIHSSKSNSVVGVVVVVIVQVVQHIFKIGTGSEVTPGCPLFMCSE